MIISRCRTLTLIASDILENIYILENISEYIKRYQNKLFFKYLITTQNTYPDHYLLLLLHILLKITSLYFFFNVTSLTPRKNILLYATQLLAGNFQLKENILIN